MTTIKLNNYYPHLTECITLEVSEEIAVTYLPLTPEEIMEQTEDRATLYVALDHLPPVQARRVYARFILGRSVGQIAKPRAWRSAMSGRRSIRACGV